MKLLFERKNDDLDTARGMVNGLLISAVIWGAIIGLLMLMISCAQKPWTKTELAMAGIAGTLTAADWAQTRNISRNPERWMETNPLMGNHPATSRVDTHFLGSIVLVGLIAHYGPDAMASLIPDEYRQGVRDNFRTILLGGVSLVEGSCVMQNNDHGIGIRW
jgi:hypothetical protein